MATVLNVLQETRDLFSVSVPSKSESHSPVEDVAVVGSDLCARDSRSLSSAAGHLQRQVSILDVHVLGLEDVGEGIGGRIGGVVRVDLVRRSVKRVLVQKLSDRQTGRRECRKVDG